RGAGARHGRRAHRRDPEVRRAAREASAHDGHAHAQEAGRDEARDEARDEGEKESSREETEEEVTRGPKHPRRVLAATILGSSMAFIDGSVVNVALPA